MSRLAERLPTNAPGDFFVDATCIDCATCRWVAPTTFDRAAGKSRVHHQPGPGERLRAQMALLACPVSAIGTETPHDFRAARGAFPDEVEYPVYHCGYHSRKSFGAASYLIRREQGNMLVDSPRFTGPLVRRLEALGGVRWLFLTHRDDVADHQRFAAHFGCERLLHSADVGPSTRQVERPFAGTDPLVLTPDITLIPVPGHSAGSTCLLYADRFLFTGDHLAWNAAAREFTAHRTYCGHSWERQRESVERLMTLEFEWVLPGHGERVKLPRREMRAALRYLAEQMENA